MMPIQSTGHGAPRPVRGILVRQVPVRVLEISLSGCVLETPVQVCVPCAGELVLQINGEPHLDDVRLSRCNRVAGSGSVFRTAAEFLWTRGAGQKSVRWAAQNIQDGLWRRGSGTVRGVVV